MSVLARDRPRLLQLFLSLLPLFLHQPEKIRAADQSGDDSDGQLVRKQRRAPDEVGKRREGRSDHVRQCPLKAERSCNMRRHEADETQRADRQACHSRRDEPALLACKSRLIAPIAIEQRLRRKTNSARHACSRLSIDGGSRFASGFFWRHISAEGHDDQRETVTIPAPKSCKQC